MNNSTYVIRPVETGDLADIKRLLLACRQAPGEESVELPPVNLDCSYISRDKDDQVVGTACLDRVRSCGVLHSVAVAPAHRRKGLGKNLIAHCETSALIGGMTEIYLLAPSASGFFTRLEYQELSRKVVPPPIAAHPGFRCFGAEDARCFGKLV